MVAARGDLLVGRDAELGRLDRLIGALDGGPAAAVLCGGAGIGKTALWQVAAARAGATGVRVLRSRCAEVEMPIAFGALADLFGAAVGEVESALPAPQLRALTGAFGRTQLEEPADWLVLASAVLATVAALTQAGRLLIAIDDVQWLDPGSRRVLAWAFRRAGTARAGLLMTVRDDGEPDPLSLADSLPADRFDRLELGPLSAGALQHLVAERVGVHLPRPTLGRVHRASGGNPLFALEFAHSLAGRAAQPGPLAVPASLEQMVRQRVAAVPSRLRPLLEVVAALERATLPLLDRALRGGHVEELVEEAAEAELLVVNEDAVVRFSHPLLALAIYSGMGARRRRELHHRLSGLVDTVEERGRHASLATLAPDVDTAARVWEAASAAASRGALDAAAQLGDEAARLTPPSNPGTRRARLLATAGWLSETGEFEQARMRLDGLLAGKLPAGALAEALLLRAECELTDRPVLVTLLRQALAAARRPRQRWQALIRLAHHGSWVSGDVPGAAETARAALDVALETGEAPLVDLSLAALSYYQAAGGSDAIPTPRRRGSTGKTPRMQWWLLSPAFSLGSRLLWTGELDRARAVLEGAYESEARAGRHARAGFVLCALSELEWRAGVWGRAERLAQEATERLGDVNPTAYPRALAAAGAGRVEEARAISATALAWAATNDDHVALPRFRWLLGLLELSRGEASLARALLTEAQAALDDCGIREPGYLPVLPDLIESIVALGCVDEAEGLVARLEAAAGRGNRWAPPAAQRSRALMALARRDADEAAALAAAAADGFAAVGMPFDRARALLVGGSALRRAGQRRLAAERLTEAVRTFTQLGAPLWLEQAAGELRRASPRPSRGRDELTAAEARVAALAAVGRKNKEIAGELYTTVGTVEAHLTRIYRKLGIRSRAELVRRLADGALESREIAGFSRTRWPWPPT